MSFLQRTGRRFAASAVMVACFAASSAFAAMLATNDFETSYSGFTPDSGDITELVELSTYNGDSPSGSAAHPFADFGSKYLAVDSDTNMIWRSFGTRSASTYFDSYVQFTPMYGGFEYADDAKFVIFLDSATSNLCVISGKSENDPTPVTNRLTTATVEPNSWGRLTVSAISGDVFSFQIRVNGTLYATSGSVNTFYSLTAGSTLSEVGFSGTGALDNFAVRTTDPFFSGAAVATIGGENGEKYATLEEALADANGATVALTANHPGTVAVGTSGAYVIDTDSHAFGGIVGANGAVVSLSSSGNVLTYTVNAPVVIWDGSAAAYDFSTLTRTVGDITYELRSNSQHDTVTSSYIQLATANQEAAPTITANSGASNPFGNGRCTVIIKCTNMPVSTTSNRAIITLYNGENLARIGIKGNNGNGGFISDGENYDAGGTQNSVFSSGDQIIAMTYSTSDGTSYFVNGACAGTASGLKFSGFASPAGISLGGLPTSGSTMFYEMRQMKILGVAVFTSVLTAEQIAAYTFPSETVVDVLTDMAVTDINALSAADDLYLRVSDGVTITGDTTFSAATTVHFLCNGSFIIAPPSGNTATFDFSRVTGQPVVKYDGGLPSKSGDKFTATTVPTLVTDSAQWTGTVWLKNIPNSANQGQAFNPNNFGNDASAVRLTNLTGYFARYLTASPALELVDDGETPAIDFTNGYGRGEVTTLSKLCGAGTMKAATKTGGSELIRVKDWAEFTGTLNLTSGKVVVFDDKETMDGDVYEYANGICYGDGDSWGMVYVASNVTVTVPSGKTWTADKGVHVAGTLAYESLARLSAGTSVVLRDSGLIDVPGTGSVANFAMDFSKVSGTGAIKYTGSSWGGISTNHLASTIGVVLENTAGVIVPNALTPTPNAENVITNGYLSGSGGLRCDYNWNGSGDNKYRTLRVQQDRNSTWSGTHIDEQNRLTLSVAPGASTTGTLTLSGTQTQSAALVVETNASVCITGTWKGTVTVYGTLSGTNTITGAVTLSDGATLKVDDTSHRLSATSLTASGTVSVVLPAGTGTGTFITTSAMPNVSGAKFNVYVGGNLDKSLYVIATSDGLVVKRGVMFLFH